MGDLGRIALRRALKALFRPIARFSIRHGLRIQDLLEEAKFALVEAAQREILASGTKSNTSRLSVLTGLQRRDVDRILAAEADTSSEARDLLSRVLGQWEQDPRFVTKDGLPAVLDFDSPNSRFHELIRSVTKNVSPMAVLFELERMGAIARSPRGLKLAKRGGDFSHDMAGAMELVSRDIESLMQCVEENVSPGATTGNLHIRTDYDNIYVRAVPEVRQWLVDRGKEFHRAAREFLARFDKDVNPSNDPREPAGVKVTLQAFSMLSSEEVAASPRDAAVRRASN